MHTALLQKHTERWRGVQEPPEKPLAQLTRFLVENVYPVLCWRAPDGTTIIARGSTLSKSGPNDTEWRTDYHQLADEIRGEMQKDDLAFFLLWFNPLDEADERWEGFQRIEVFRPVEIHAYEPSDHTSDSRPDMVGASESGRQDGVAEFYHAAERLIDELRSGALEKVVLARIQELELDKSVNVAAVLGELNASESDCTIILYAPEKGKIFLCATPEHLATVDGSTFRSEAVAGTDLLHDPAIEDNRKIDDEHRHVVEMISKSAEEFCTGIRIDKPEIRVLRNVRHRVTPIEGTLREGRSIIDAVSTLHPTPAVAGVPRDAAMQRIRKHEPFSRGLYAGTIGWMDRDGNGEAIVAIRSALIDETLVTVFAGAGLVQGSDPRQEYEETQWKMLSIMTVFETGTA